MKQTKDYNCGVFACLYILEKFGIEAEPDFIEQLAKTNPHRGTTHEDMERVFVYYNISIESGTGDISLLRTKLPAIVNYWDVDDGHYGVVVEIGEKTLKIFDPAEGEIVEMLIEDFEKNWFSKRYGKNWYLHPTGKK